jgi:hypothetical protein
VKFAGIVPLFEIVADDRAYVPLGPEAGLFVPMPHRGKDGEVVVVLRAINPREIAAQSWTVYRRRVTIEEQDEPNADPSLALARAVHRAYAQLCERGTVHMAHGHHLPTVTLTRYYLVPERLL